MRQFAKPWLLLLGFLALGMKPSSFTSAAGGDCLYDCQGPICSDFGNRADFCLELRAKCQARCSGRRWWGAIAYSSTDHKAGWSYEFNTAEAAKERALAHCIAAKGNACKIWASFENECGALAADGNIAAWGTAFMKENATKRAIEECRKAGGKTCAIEAWVCSKM